MMPTFPGCEFRSRLAGEPSQSAEHLIVAPRCYFIFTFSITGPSIECESFYLTYDRHLIQPSK